MINHEDIRNLQAGVTARDLDVFVLTYNRANYLKAMLESLCNQTAQGFVIKVLDNASTDHTANIIQEIQEKRPDRRIVHIVNNENIGSPANFKKSQELADNEYTAVFHDDDVIHPAYIETAMELLSKHPDSVMLSCFPTTFVTYEPKQWVGMEKGYLLWNPENIVFLSCLIRPYLFAAMVYKTEAYKSAVYYPEKYGKIFDVIFVLEVGKKGKSIMMEGSGIQYRLHDDSDSNHSATGPFSNEIIAVIKSVHQQMKGHRLIRPFLIYMKLLKMYKWAKISNLSKSDLEKMGIEENLFNFIHVNFMHYGVFRFLLRGFLQIIRFFYVTKTSCRKK